jgi:hypothetical protein
MSEEARLAENVKASKAGIDVDHLIMSEANALKTPGAKLLFWEKIAPAVLKMAILDGWKPPEPKPKDPMADDEADKFSRFGLMFGPFEGRAIGELTRSEINSISEDSDFRRQCRRYAASNYARRRWREI